MEKLKEPITFNELVNMHTRNIHSALLEGGGKSMQGAVYSALANALDWREEYNAWEKQNKKNKE